MWTYVSFLYTKPSLNPKSKNLLSLHMPSGKYLYCKNTGSNMWVNVQYWVLRQNFDNHDNTFEKKRAFELQMFSHYEPKVLTDLIDTADSVILFLSRFFLSNSRFKNWDSTRSKTKMENWKGDKKIKLWWTLWAEL